MVFELHQTRRSAFPIVYTKLEHRRITIAQAVIIT